MTTSNKTMQASKFIANATDMIMERDGIPYAEALAQAESMAMAEGLIPTPKANARIRRKEFHNANIGELQVAKAPLKRKFAACRLDRDCQHRDAEFI
jgi:hypothetical protein